MHVQCRVERWREAVFTDEKLSQEKTAFAPSRCLSGMIYAFDQCKSRTRVGPLFQKPGTFLMRDADAIDTDGDREDVTVLHRASLRSIDFRSVCRHASGIRTGKWQGGSLGEDIMLSLNGVICRHHAKIFKAVSCHDSYNLQIRSHTRSSRKKMNFPACLFVLPYHLLKLSS